MGRVIDVTGKTFGRLLVLERTTNNKHGSARWLCRCTCGTMTTVFTTNLLNGSTKSCGCLAKELLSKRNSIEIVWKITSGGCKVPTSHALNQDGYFRKMQPGGRVRMMHVIAWEKDRGRSCPPDKEIHHLCGIRNCCNPKHLKAVNQGSHIARHNSLRGVRRRWAANKYWKLTGFNGVKLAAVFNVTSSSACLWIKTWKAEEKDRKKKGGNIF